MQLAAAALKPSKLQRVRSTVVPQAVAVSCSAVQLAAATLKPSKLQRVRSTVVPQAVAVSCSAVQLAAAAQLQHTSGAAP